MKIKKFGILALIGVLSMPSSILARDFKDIDKNGSFSWAYEYINELSNKNIINGYEDGTFKPNRPVSFLETMQIIKTLINPSSDIVKRAYEIYKNDIQRENVPSWAIDAVAFNLYNETITTKTLSEANRRGFIKNKVYPSRNSVAIYIARALKLSNYGDKNILKYKDFNNISNATLDYLPELVNQGIFTATGSDGFFNGNKYIRRSEMAVISSNTLRYLEKYPYTSIVNNIYDNKTEDLNIVEDKIDNNANINNNFSNIIEEEVNFSGKIIEIIDANNIKYLKIKVDYSENSNIKIDDIISVTAQRNYGIGDSVNASAKIIDGIVRDIRLK